MKDKVRKDPQAACEAWSYGIGGIPSTMETQLKNSYHMAFLTEIVGLDARLIGVSNTLLTIWDAVNDIIIGNIADRTNTRMGKYRPHMLWGILLWTVISIMMFLKVDFGGSGTMAYYIILLTVWSVACTGFVLPWQSLNSVMSTDVGQRNKMLMLRTVLGTLAGTLLGVVMPLAIRKHAGKGYFIVAVTAALIGLVCGLLCIHGARHKDYQGAIPTPPGIRFQDAVKLFAVRPVLCVALMLGSCYLTSGLLSVTGLYFYKYVVQDVRVMSITSLFALIAGLGLVPFIPKLYVRWGRGKTYLTGIALQLIQPILLISLGAKMPVILVVATAFLYTCGFAVTNMTILSFVPDCCDYSELHFGTPNAGQISSIVSFMKKAMNSLSTTILGFALSFGGYVDASTPITDKLVHSIIFVQAGVPIVLIAIALLAFRLFPIKGEYEKQMRAELAEKRAAKQTDREVTAK